MTIAELRKLERQELVQKSNELVNELKQVKFVLKSGAISAENVNRAREIKKEVARIKTILTERALIENA